MKQQNQNTGAAPATLAGEVAALRALAERSLNVLWELRWMPLLQKDLAAALARPVPEDRTAELVEALARVAEDAKNGLRIGCHEYALKEIGKDAKRSVARAEGRAS